MSEPRKLDGVLSLEAHEKAAYNVTMAAVTERLRIANCRNKGTGQLEPVLMILVLNPDRTVSFVPVATLLSPASAVEFYDPPNDEDQPRREVEPVNLVLPYTQRPTQ